MVRVEKCHVVFIGRVFCAACARTLSHIFFLCFVGICNFFFPFVANRTDGCTSGYYNWANGEPNNGRQDDPSTETVAAILFQDVTIFPAGELFDDDESHLRPAIYECCESAPSGAPSGMPVAPSGMPV